MSDLYTDPVITSMLDEDGEDHEATKANETACGHCRAARWRVGARGHGLFCYCTMMAVDVATPDEPATTTACTGQILAEDAADADDDDDE